MISRIVIGCHRKSTRSHHTFMYWHMDCSSFYTRTARIQHLWTSSALSIKCEYMAIFFLVSMCVISCRKKSISDVDNSFRKLKYNWICTLLSFRIGFGQVNMTFPSKRLIGHDLLMNIRCLHFTNSQRMLISGNEKQYLVEVSTGKTIICFCEFMFQQQKIITGLKTVFNLQLKQIGKNHFFIFP